MYKLVKLGSKANPFEAVAKDTKETLEIAQKFLKAKGFKGRRAKTSELYSLEFERGSETVAISFWNYPIILDVLYGTVKYKYTDLPFFYPQRIHELSFDRDLTDQEVAYYKTQCKEFLTWLKQNIK